MWLTCRQAWHQHPVQESRDLGPSGRPWRCNRQVETVASSRVRGRVVAETLSKTTSCFTRGQRVAGFRSGPLRVRAGRDFGQVGVQVASKKGVVEIVCCSRCFCRYHDFESKQL